MPVSASLVVLIKKKKKKTAFQAEKTGCANALFQEKSMMHSQNERKAQVGAKCSYGSEGLTLIGPIS